jgi:mono/diheme cytochrome c family protein
LRERTIKQRFLLFFVLLIVFSLFGCAEESVDYPARTMPDGILKDKIQLNRGEALFMDKCAFCHGKPGEGRSDRATFFEPAAPDFTDEHYRQMDPAYLYWRIEVGKTVEPFRSQGSVMPAWGMHLTEQQLWQIVAYLQVRAH